MIMCLKMASKSCYPCKRKDVQLKWKGLIQYAHLKLIVKRQGKFK